MTQMEALEEMKQVFTTQKNELEEARSEIYTRKEQAMSDALFPYFEGFNPDVYIEVTRGSIYFKMDHSELSYRKELFTLYLRERYFEEGQRYDGVDLSYYTTSTKGDDEWELKRLKILGDAAEVVLKRQHDIVDTANYTSNLFKDEFKLDPSDAQYMFVIGNIPGSLKLLYGLVIDNFKIYNSRKKSLMLLGAIL